MGFLEVLRDGDELNPWIPGETWTRPGNLLHSKLERSNILLKGKSQLFRLGHLKNSYVNVSLPFRVSTTSTSYLDVHQGVRHFWPILQMTGPMMSIEPGLCPGQWCQHGQLSPARWSTWSTSSRSPKVGKWGKCGIKSHVSGWWVSGFIHVYTILYYPLVICYIAIEHGHL